MKREYKTEQEIMSLVKSFEDATIPHGNWQHPEHLIVALYYLSHHDQETATEKMRTGIINLLENGFGVDLKKETPYHETITIFWMRTVASFLASTHGVPLAEKIDEMTRRFDKDYPLRFYTRDRLFSDEARARFIDGDLHNSGPLLR